MNDKSLQDLVKGRYGRKIAYADVETITPENVLKVVSENIGTFNFNRGITKYLWDYKKGDQPVLYRTKVERDDIINKVVENHAYEIVQFNVAQTYGEPIQYVSTQDSKEVNDSVDTFNDYMKRAFKHQRNVAQGEWKSATGTSFLAVH